MAPCGHARRWPKLENLARAERRDGWDTTWIERLRDGAEITY